MRLKRYRTKIFAQVPIGKGSGPQFWEGKDYGAVGGIDFSTPTFFPFPSWLHDLVPHKQLWKWAEEMTSEISELTEYMHKTFHFSEQTAQEAPHGVPVRHEETRSCIRSMFVAAIVAPFRARRKIHPCAKAQPRTPGTLNFHLSP